MQRVTQRISAYVKLPMVSSVAPRLGFEHIVYLLSIRHLYRPFVYMCKAVERSVYIEYKSIVKLQRIKRRLIRLNPMSGLCFGRKGKISLLTILFLAENIFP